jgi:hypothetical protein
LALSVSSCRRTFDLLILIAVRYLTNLSMVFQWRTYMSNDGLARQSDCDVWAGTEFGIGIGIGIGIGHRRRLSKIFITGHP